MVDNDTVQIHSATRSGNTNIEINFTWRDSAGVDKGRYGVSFGTAEEARDFLDSQGMDDVIRPVLTQVIDRNDGSFRPAVFDGLAGKTFRVQQRVQQV
jgi:hypothetical protein